LRPILKPTARVAASAQASTSWHLPGCERKTAPAPPAVRAPVFPQTLPVTEGMKYSIWAAATRRVQPPPVSASKLRYPPP